MKELTTAFGIKFSETDQKEGWAFGRPVGIKTNQWPRSRINGLPMAHIWTLLVPEEYRVKGEEFIAISLFSADDHVDNDISEVINVIENKVKITDSNSQSFWDSLLEYAENKHPKEIFFEDLLGGGWALIWLTEEEFNSVPTNLPDEKVCVFPNYEDWEESAYKHYIDNNQSPEFVKFVPRKNDPNVGKKLEDYPDEDDDNAYIEMFSNKGEELNLERFFGENHFGGTASPAQAMPEFSPYYIEFGEELGGANLGGDGCAQIDLLNDELDWACG